MDAGKQDRLREINKELSTLAITFSNHVLNENNAYQLVIEDEAELAGLPEWVKAGAAEEAKAAGKEGKPFAAIAVCRQPRAEKEYL